MKLVVVVLIAMIVTQFAMYHELDKRAQVEQQLNQLRWKAQIEAFGVYSKVINEQSRLLTQVVGQLGVELKKV